MDRYQIIRIIHDYMSRYEKKNKFIIPHNNIFLYP